MRQRFLWAGIGIALLVLAGAWLVAGPRGRASGGARSAPEVARTHESEDDAELAEPGVPAVDETMRREQPPPDAAALARGAETPRSAGGRRRATILGQLWIAGTEEPLAAALSIRVRSADLSRGETVETRADGSFETSELYPRGFVLATVRRPAGDDAGEYEGWFDPSSDEIWPVRIPWPTFVRGRVVDRRGEAVPDVTVYLSVRSISGEPTRYGTRDNGTFWIQGLRPESGTLAFCRGFERFERRVALERGPNELGDVVVPFASLVEISGTLIAEGHAPLAELRLEDVASGARTEIVAEQDDPEVESATFTFQDVPPGEYRLSAVGIHGVRYEPAEMRVVAPAADLVFRATEAAEPFALDVRAADLGYRAVVLVRVRGAWDVVEWNYARADVERWVAFADGFRPRSGATDESEVELQPGFSCAFLFQEASAARGRPVPDVAVLADGREIARSGTDGLALVDLDAAPKGFAFSADGWVALESRWQTTRLNAIVMVRE